MRVARCPEGREQAGTRPKGQVSWVQTWCSNFFGNQEVSIFSEGGGCGRWGGRFEKVSGQFEKSLE